MQNSLKDELKVARQSLLHGVKLSLQGSYARRAPSPESLPHFGEARTVLNKVLERFPHNRIALSMMSQLSEILLEFEAAVDFLNKAFYAGEPKTKKTLKRLALLLENTRVWQDLLLTSGMLNELGKHLEMKGVGPNHRTLRITHEWLTANMDCDPDEVIAALERRGAFSDFQVLANVVHG